MNNIVMDIKKDCVINSLDKHIIINPGLDVTINLDKCSIKECVIDILENSHLTINKSYKEDNVEESITINLNGENSKIDYNFSTITSANQKYIINVNHNNKTTISNVINHGVVLNDSSLYFEVNSYVSKGKLNSVLNQESKIMLMGKNNSMIKPNLFIDEYNVDARHAAAIGKFNKDNIFYLMTKGISYDKALELLIDGFLNGHIGGNYE